MDAEIKKALEESIQHWKDNAEASEPEDVSTRAEDCSLCLKFNKSIKDIRKTFEPDCCAGCPVFEKTKKPRCKGTPYSEAVINLQSWYQVWSQVLPFADRKKYERHFRDAANKEVEFLESLREPYNITIGRNAGTQLKDEKFVLLFGNDIEAAGSYSVVIGDDEHCITITDSGVHIKGLQREAIRRAQAAILEALWAR